MQPDKQNLLRLVDECHEGKIVLPDFQRSFVWGTADIRDLVVSILNDYFIGSLLIINIIPENPPFGFRKVEGVADNHAIPQQMVLDGQQRLTSLHYILYESDIPLKNTTRPYGFYLDLRKALNNDDLEEAIYILPREQAERKGYYDEKNQYRELVIPFSTIKNWDTWYSNALEYFIENKYNEHRTIIKEMNEKDSPIKILKSYQVPIIYLSNDTKIEKVCEIFERLNSTGVPLSVFDLITAKLYPKNINLRKLWENCLNESELLSQFSEITVKFPVYLLQIMALMRGEGVKKKDLINLDWENFAEDFKQAFRYLVEALKRVTLTHVSGYGVIKPKWLPYVTVLPPLSALLHIIKDNNNPETYFKKLHCWYWASIFTERYTGSTDSLMKRDYDQMQKWFEDNENLPEAIAGIGRRELDLENYERDTSAVYRGVINLITLKGAQDFRSGDSIVLNELEDHHIFPKSVFKDKIPRGMSINTILNRTLISNETNRFIGNKTPAQYLKELIEEHHLTETRLKKILATHFINEKAYQAMLNNDYETFISERKQEILNEIKRRVDYAN